MDEDEEKMLQEEQEAFQCPRCNKTFKRKSSLARHLEYTCKELPGEVVLTSPRVPTVAAPTSVEIGVDEELDNLLGTIESDYARWRLSLALRVSQKSTFPVLFSFRFPGAKDSPLSSLCPTSDPNTVMYNVLTDARINFQIEKIVMPKVVTMV